MENKTVKIKLPQVGPGGKIEWRIVEVNAELAAKQLSKPDAARNSGWRGAVLVEEHKQVENAKVPEKTETKETEVEATTEIQEEPKTEVKPKRTRKK